MSLAHRNALAVQEGATGARGGFRLVATPARPTHLGEVEHRSAVVPEQIGRRGPGDRVSGQRIGFVAAPTTREDPRRRAAPQHLGECVVGRGVALGEAAQLVGLVVAR